jgi:23S rRNA (cytidine1920-2'-O)/16S rRNA (cytidine1409-2'-O)-methyltransferase
VTVTRQRLDSELVRRGLAANLAEARRAVADGMVDVSGSPALKATTLIGRDQAVELRGASGAYVSRGGDKLRAGLGRFGLDPAGRRCLDAGASTGGFTDCLLRAGAAAVIAVDVGYGQLAWALRTDPRVRVLERTNVRDLRRSDLPFEPTLVVADLSFISLRTVIPALRAAASADATFVVLVKPQFEARRDEVEPGGVVRDARVWHRVLGEVAAAFAAAGAGPRAAMASPILGPAGNAEFLMEARAGRAAALTDADLVAVAGSAADRVGGAR